MFSILKSKAKKKMKKAKSKDMVFIKIYGEDGKEKEKHTLSEDDYYDYFDILEALGKNIMQKSKKIKDEGFKSEKEKEEFEQVEKSLNKLHDITNKACKMKKIKVICFEGDIKEKYLEIKIYKRNKELAESYTMEYEEIKGYIEIIKTISSKLVKIANYNPFQKKKKNEQKDNKIITNLIGKLEKIGKIQILALSGDE
jgi:hypothetical protein